MCIEAQGRIEAVVRHACRVKERRGQLPVAGTQVFEEVGPVKAGIANPEEIAHEGRPHVLAGRDVDFPETDVRRVHGGLVALPCQPVRLGGLTLGGHVLEDAENGFRLPRRVEAAFAARGNPPDPAVGAHDPALEVERLLMLDRPVDAGGDMIAIVGVVEVDGIREDRFEGFRVAAMDVVDRIGPEDGFLLEVDEPVADSPDGFGQLQPFALAPAQFVQGTPCLAGRAGSV